MILLGIDPGLATIGLGLLEAESPQKMRALDWLTIQTPAGLPLSARLCEIQTDLQTYLTETKPDLVVIEKLFFAVNEKTAIDVAQARGVIVQTVAAQGIEILEATPLQMKSALTGDGQADKRQVQDMLVHTLQLPELPQPDDAADALGLAVYGAVIQNQLVA